MDYQTPKLLPGVSGVDGKLGLRRRRRSLRWVRAWQFSFSACAFVTGCSQSQSVVKLVVATYDLSYDDDKTETTDESKATVESLLHVFPDLALTDSRRNEWQMDGFLGHRSESEALLLCFEAGGEKQFGSV